MKSAKWWNEIGRQYDNHLAWIEAIQADARADLEAKITACDKIWNDMHFTICKLEQDLRKAKGEQ